MMDNTDPRYVRSRLKLRSAFLELAREDPDKLSVSSVCERTGVDRATFYRHFETIDDLVADALGDLANQATVEWESTTTGSGTQFDEAFEITAAYLSHIEQNWRLYQWALGPTGSAKTIHALLDRTMHAVAFEFAKLDHSLTEEERAFRASYTAGGLLGVCIQWLSTETPSYTSRELAARFIRISEQRLDYVFTQ
ncbi:TetR/AcrR family transcriptional regulator [Leifsonia aquatica]|uniref:TetR/AcrR family transcriptional regulator n=1 Tax=Leifsonia aquatica TaxID=144185 RepID=UPI0028AD087A|nr:TetR/AcrR family transcriptional regulator [Leifsonia aquatica]